MFCPTIPVLGASSVNRYGMYCDASEAHTLRLLALNPICSLHTLRVLEPMYVSPLLISKSISTLKRPGSDLPQCRFPKLPFSPHHFIKNTCFNLIGPSVDLNQDDWFWTHGIPRHFARQCDYCEAKQANTAPASQHFTISHAQPEIIKTVFIGWTGEGGNVSWHFPHISFMKALLALQILYKKPTWANFALSEKNVMVPS